MIAHYFIQKVVKSTGFRKNPESRTFFVFEMWINLREKNEKGSFSVASRCCARTRLSSVGTTHEGRLNPGRPEAMKRPGAW